MLHAHAKRSLSCIIFLLLSVGSFVATRPSTGCEVENPYPVGQPTNESISTSDGLRTYHIYIPVSYNNSAPVPLVVLIHGTYGSGLGAEAKYGMDAYAEKFGFIVAYPDAINFTVRTWNGGSCCGLPARDGIDDVGFISSMIGVIESQLCIDTARIFATGMSAGGILTHRLGCELADTFAAIAPVEGTLEYPCNATRAIPIFKIHGNVDDIVPFYGGIGCGPGGNNFTSVNFTLQTLTSSMGCSCPYSPNSPCGKVVLTDGDGICTQYGTCAQGTTVTMCVIQGGGHAWPDAGSQGFLVAPQCNFTTGTFQATLHIANFFMSIGNGTTTTSTSSSSSSGSGLMSWLSILFAAWWKHPFLGSF